MKETNLENEIQTLKESRTNDKNFLEQQLQQEKTKVFNNKFHISIFLSHDIDSRIYFLGECFILKVCRI